MPINGQTFNGLEFGLPEAYPRLVAWEGLPIEVLKDVRDVEFRDRGIAERWQKRREKSRGSGCAIVALLQLTGFCLRCSVTTCRKLEIELKLPVVARPLEQIPR